MWYLIGVLYVLARRIGETLNAWRPGRDDGNWGQG